jgi:hypothetical protein
MLCEASRLDDATRDCVARSRPIAAATDSERHRKMKTIGLILLAILAGTVDAQDTAPPAVDLYSGQKEPEVTPEPLAPNVPELSQLDEAFKQKSLGKEADQHRVHIEWRQLKNQVVNDPSVRAAKAAALAARTDLEKRNRLRNYYNVYYDRMSALASSAEMKLALEALKTTYFASIDQPRVRPSPPPAGSSPTPTPTPERKHHKKHGR